MLDLFASDGFSGTYHESAERLGCQNGLLALACPACAYGLAVERVPKARLGGKRWLATSLYCLLSPLGALTSCLCVVPMTYQLRRQAVPGEDVWDAAFVSCCCAPCALAESRRELSMQPEADNSAEVRGTLLAAPRAPQCSRAYCR
jgi:hypothetical protein